jgi:hypothetical protein
MMANTRFNQLTIGAEFPPELVLQVLANVDADTLFAYMQSNVFCRLTVLQEAPLIGRLAEAMVNSIPPSQTQNLFHLAESNPAYLQAAINAENASITQHRFFRPVNIALKNGFLDRLPEVKGAIISKLDAEQAAAAQRERAAAESRRFPSWS